MACHPRRTHRRGTSSPRHTHLYTRTRKLEKTPRVPSSTITHTCVSSVSACMSIYPSARVCVSADVQRPSLHCQGRQPRHACTPLEESEHGQREARREESIERSLAVCRGAFCSECRHRRRRLAVCICARGYRVTLRVPGCVPADLWVTTTSSSLT